MSAPKKTIEFIPKEDWEKSVSGKLLKWALSTGRHIVIFTELIVILAFLSRFKFDRDLTDISEEVKQKQTIVANYAQFEKEFRLLQAKLDTIDKLRKNRGEKAKILTDISALLPNDVFLSDFNVIGNQLQISGVALSENGLAAYMRSLRASGKFSPPILIQAYSDIEKEIGIKFQIKTEVNYQNGV